MTEVWSPGLLVKYGFFLLDSSVHYVGFGSISAHWLSSSRLLCQLSSCFSGTSVMEPKKPSNSSPFWLIYCPQIPSFCYEIRNSLTIIDNHFCIWNCCIILSNRIFLCLNKVLWNSSWCNCFDTLSCYNRFIAWLYILYNHTLLLLDPILVSLSVSLMPNLFQL